MLYISFADYCQNVWGLNVYRSDINNHNKSEDERKKEATIYIVINESDT